MPSLDPRLIARGFHLDRRDRVRAARALGWLIAATAAVRLFSYATLTRAIAKIPAGRSRGTTMTPDECATAIRRATRLWPAQCLPQALAGCCLLRRAGHAPTVTLGAAMEERRLDAHAWLECDGVVVIGGDQERRYTPFTATGRQAP